MKIASICKILEINDIFKSNCFGESNLGKRALYPTLNLLSKPPQIANFLAFYGGKRECIEFSVFYIQVYELEEVIRPLLEYKLIQRITND